jgi:hypothetical protein
MNILIVGDSGFRARHRKALRFLLEARGGEWSVTDVASLEGARSNLGGSGMIVPAADGVVCQARGANWARLAIICHNAGVPLVAVLSDAGAAEGFNVAARERGLHKWPAFALLEPVDAEFVAKTIIAAALGRQAAGARGPGAGTRIEKPSDRKNGDGGALQQRA